MSLLSSFQRQEKTESLHRRQGRQNGHLSACRELCDVPCFAVGEPILFLACNIVSILIFRYAKATIPQLVSSILLWVIGRYQLTQSMLFSYSLIRVAIGFTL